MKYLELSIAFGGTIHIRSDTIVGLQELGRETLLLLDGGHNVKILHGAKNLIKELEQE